MKDLLIFSLLCGSGPLKSPKNSPTDMRLCKNIYLTIVAVLLWALPLAAQIHPVTVTHTMVPPYTSRLSDYATALNTKLRLQLLLTDINVA
ncbi:MAG: hypothetical protein ABJX94_15930, partial [Flavobacteriaceae bacterium]